MPKRGCDVNTCEIAKFYRLNNSGLCQVVSMTVPRRSELFQEDLYPDTLSDEASVTAEEWVAGTDAEPVMVSLKVSVVCVLCGTDYWLPGGVRIAKTHFKVFRLQFYRFIDNIIDCVLCLMLSVEFSCSRCVNHQHT